MSIFYCTHCDKFADSDNGCGEINGDIACDRCVDDAAEASSTEGDGDE